MAISTKIKRIREVKGLSQEYMANGLNISQSAYSKIERSDKNINIDRLKEISTLLEVDPMEFFTKSDDVVFNNCNSSGFYNNYTNLPDKFIATLEKQITEQQKEIDYLRRLLEKSLLS